MVSHFCYRSVSHFLEGTSLLDVLASLPEARKTRISSTKNKSLLTLRLAQELALIDALSQLGEDYSSLVIAYLETGKPYVEGRPDLAISFSHRGNYGCAYCVKSLDGAPVACGVDIEEVTPLEEKHLRLKNRFLPQDTPMQPLDFFRAWTKTESFVKLTGEGMGGAKNICMTKDVLYSHLFLEDEQGKSYMVCLAHKKEM